MYSFFYPLKTSGMDLIPSQCKSPHKLTRFLLLKFKFRHKQISILPVRWCVRSVTKKKKANPLLTYCTGLTCQLKQGFRLYLRLTKATSFVSVLSTFVRFYDNKLRSSMSIYTPQRWI